ncbi:hypothetical protein SBA4_4590018 [Candidatus Sulfopaludibacter sp. SbA4]|nr:hypothetical protein SBA4_4590018 [Candidatus Sulfopaludibacter sp. SbA4]
MPAAAIASKRKTAPTKRRWSPCNCWHGPIKPVRRSERFAAACIAKKVRLPCTPTFDVGSVRGARFVGANLAAAIFSSCDVDGADLSNANLSTASFDTNHEKACFEGATLHRVVWNAENASRRWAAPSNRPSPPPLR